jgi:uncharacterized membrane protein YhdT
MFSSPFCVFVVFAFFAFLYRSLPSFPGYPPLGIEKPSMLSPLLFLLLGGSCSIHLIIFKDLAISGRIAIHVGVAAHVGNVTIDLPRSNGSPCRHQTAQNYTTSIRK